MALEQRNTIRWKERIGTWIKDKISFLVEVLSSFLDFREGDEFREKGIKTLDLAARRALYFGMDYGITIVHVSVGVTMKALGCSLLTMFGVIWALDFVVAGAFIVIYEITGKDVSLGADFRRAVETIKKKSPITGFLSTLGITFLAVVWTGPEKVITFFRKEIGPTRQLLAVLITLTAVQSFLWASLYYFAYEFVLVLLE